MKEDYILKKQIEDDYIKSYYETRLKKLNVPELFCVLEGKFGKNIMLKGIDFFEKATQRERNEQIGGHRSGENENAKNKSSCTVCTI